MYGVFLKCSACKRSLNYESDRDSFPICLFCLESLIPCPPLCKSCGSPICYQNPNQACFRIWAHDPNISSYSARYLLIGNSYNVLKHWKKRGGLIFDRRVLTSTPILTSQWNEAKIDAIVPIPQRFSRAWKMGGSRTERIASWLARILRKPVLRILSPPGFPVNSVRQAELNVLERLQNPIQFSVDFDELNRLQNRSRPSQVLLVDDFRTTGRTLKQGAKILKQAGLSHVHTFSLGIRTFHINS